MKQSIRKGRELGYALFAPAQYHLILKDTFIQPCFTIFAVWHLLDDGSTHAADYSVGFPGGCPRTHCDIRI